MQSTHIFGNITQISFLSFLYIDIPRTLCYDVCVKVMTFYIVVTSMEYTNCTKARKEHPMKKRACIIALVLMLVCSLFVPAYGAESSGNGYHIRDIYYNGKKYESVLSALHKLGTAEACTVISCQAYAPFTQYSVHATFETKNYGYISATGASQSGRFSAGHTSIESPPAVCSKGADQVILCRNISGDAVIYGDSNVELHARMIVR